MRRKTAHRRGTLPVGSLRVERPFERVSSDLVDHKTICTALERVRCKCVLFIVDHLTRFAVILVAIPNKSSETVTRVLIECVIVFLVRQKCYIQIRLLSSKTNYSPLAARFRV